MSGRDRLANHAWEGLLSAHARLMKGFAAEEIWGDVSMREYDVLYTLSKCSGPVRIGELHRHVLLSQPALSRLVDRLVERGLVLRVPSPADKRGVSLSLTSLGLETQRRIGGQHARSVTRAVTSALSQDELAQLAVLTWKLAGSEGTLRP
ncbi:MarR family winged helix-turn-helix transcriptional regulator [Tenggerimyces flavus]|uniref:MarR family winged helix-turn-helix transcriptional regulator n=1 Tax=Tenggerimyces flavus TaxID=1708749 RepID=A0ABV7YGU1_9ACTN|nr:MarR family transcriptional regulator [Tenggerimyces flavus]MBM7784262.1 DNA-binding MarR family transcriptional regulator [Tenggerimyces flavus]